MSKPSVTQRKGFFVGFLHLLWLIVACIPPLKLLLSPVFCASQVAAHRSLKCPHCGEKLTLADGATEQQAHCPRCGKSLSE